jgi:DNA-binding transcriptional MerR regulator
MLKNKSKLISISELSEKLGLVSKKNKKPLNHTLRFWETKFKQLKPLILPGKRRYYTIKDVETAKMIYFLLKVQGFTINGAKKAMNENIKHLDDTKTSSIKATYYEEEIKKKTKNILNRIKKIKWQKKHTSK